MSEPDWAALAMDPNFRALFTSSVVAKSKDGRLRVVMNPPDEGAAWKARGFLEALEWLESLPGRQASQRTAAVEASGADLRQAVRDSYIRGGSLEPSHAVE